MAQLSGLTLRDADNPDGDIEVAVTGLRPGEKLYEELLIGERPQATTHQRIMKAQEEFVQGESLNLSLSTLYNAATTNNTSVTTDDTYGFQLTVSGTGTSSSGWSTIINGATITGSYGVPKTIGNFNTNLQPK